MQPHSKKAIPSASVMAKGSLKTTSPPISLHPTCCPLSLASMGAAADTPTTKSSTFPRSPSLSSHHHNKLKIRHSKSRLLLRITYALNMICNLMTTEAISPNLHPVTGATKKGCRLETNESEKCIRIAFDEPGDQSFTGWTHKS
ncbi:hypothetical protein EYF80_015396 [Liparis tanakae]|uniref:Uncharacterized protein n=1 Tax=Liparis tanakae TaxID=230148 RepID=A0A4Z2I8X3_9TELE|nr:hypothetical protein EYF80_015396 [Liparis tanakae]